MHVQHYGATNITVTLPVYTYKCINAITQIQAIQDLQHR